MTHDWHVLIRNALVFDGTGGAAAPARTSPSPTAASPLAARPLDPARAERVVDATGRWLMPGLLDIHTHLDLEVELAPGLPESVRHGTTTVVVGNCSLGTAFGAQRRNGDDPILDCFTRVENMPKSVLRKVVDRIDWNTTGGLPRAPRPAAARPEHRAAAAAFDAAHRGDGHRRRPCRASPRTTSCARMRAPARATRCAQGYAGFSTDAIPFHYLANAPHTDKRIPAQHATWASCARCSTWCAATIASGSARRTPRTASPTFLRFFLTSGRLFGRPLRTSRAHGRRPHARAQHLEAVPADRRTCSTRGCVNGRFHFQVLGHAVPHVRGGRDLPDLRGVRVVAAADGLRHRGRRRPGAASWRATTSASCSCANGTTRARSPPSTATSTRCTVERCPVPEWQGETFGAIYRRLQAFQSGDATAARSAAEREALAAFPNPIGREGAFLLHLVRRYDRDLRWWFTVANDRPEILRAAAVPPAHAAGLQRQRRAPDQPRVLRRQPAHAAGGAARESLEMVAQAVRRLTREPAEFFGVDAGRLDVGAQADLVLIDPEALRSVRHRREPSHGVPRHLRARAARQSLGRRGSGGVHRRRAGLGRRASSRRRSGKQLGRPLRAGSQLAGWWPEHRPAGGLPGHTEVSARHDRTWRRFVGDPAHRVVTESLGAGVKRGIRVCSTLSFVFDEGEPGKPATAAMPHVRNGR